MLFQREGDDFFGLRLDPVGQIEMDDIAGMLEIADIERDFQGPPGLFR